MTAKDKTTLSQVNANKVHGTFFSKHHVDLPLLFGLFLALCFSLFILYSASGQEIDMLTRQVTRTGAAFLLMIAVAQIPPRYYAKLSIYLYILGLILLVLVELFGDISKGAQRWLNLGVVRIQPSEIFKVVMPLMVATFLSKGSLPPKILNTIIAFVIVGMPTVLILMQPDLGTASLVAVAGFIAIFIAGLSWWWIIVGAGLAAAALPVMWNFVLHDYQKQRVFTLLDPSSDPLGAGYHIIQSKIAIGSGMIFGKGIFNGTQSQLNFLPENHTDFIFSVIGEEFGFVGCIIVLLLLFMLIYRSIQVAYTCNDNFGMLLATGIGTMFTFEVLVNVGMTIGIMPVTGIPLPFLSYGVSALTTNMLSIGILLNIARQRTKYIF